GMIPVFSTDFLIDFREPKIQRAIGVFDLDSFPTNFSPIYGFAGVERRRAQPEMTMRLQPNGALILGCRIPLAASSGEQQNFYPVAIDYRLRNFVLRAAPLYEQATITAPYLLSLMIWTWKSLAGVSGNRFTGEGSTPIFPGRYSFPVMLVEDIADVDRSIRPLCDHIHQTFGRAASPEFGASGEWIGKDK
ncbi:MAG TPA: hypothetical protein VJ723_10990, partial [Candidatus Angelobacter sp.]|nr:hypothetical protein [Candidatus Angelobacter sp.]